MNDEKTINFTIHSEDDFYDTVDSEMFADKDADFIYEHLQKKMKLIPFGDYLKRYIYVKAGFEEPFDEVDIKEYQYLIVSSFAENGTPKSFSETSSKLSALAKNWLTQTSVTRNVVFLLGFGLNMNAEDVSRFLMYAQRESDFNFKDPFEIICWYCYKNRFRFSKFSQLTETYLSLPVNSTYIGSDATVGYRDIFFSIENEDDLIRRLSEIKTENNGKAFSVTASRHFDALYRETKNIIARQYTQDAADEAEEKAREYLEKSENSAISVEDRKERFQSIRNSGRVYTADDIGEAVVEKYLCCGIPFDGKGNLQKFSKSTLAKHFSSKRMSRKHLGEILTKKTAVDRFDLITLCFFIHAMDESTVNNKKRYSDFLNHINPILEECYMGELYIANPYECFLLMCLLSDCPMGAYSDVLERSFEE